MGELRRANVFADATPDAAPGTDASDGRRREAAAAGTSERPGSGAAEPGCSSLRFYGYWLFALAAAVSAFASHIYVRHRVVDLGYRLGQERAQRAQLQNDRRDLELELASLEAPADLAQVARDALGLDVPRDDQMIEVASAPEPGVPDRSAATVVVSPADPDGAAAPDVTGGGAPGVRPPESAVAAPEPAAGHAATAVTPSLPSPPAPPPPAPRRRVPHPQLPARGPEPAADVPAGPRPEGRGSEGAPGPAAEDPAAGGDPAAEVVP
ncbi:MAG: cell division protein FtsL [Deltaproteobacteria bacterium]|nr:cell division protein FtsL [Deltaproteobacteria bacterium]